MSGRRDSRTALMTMAMATEVGAGQAALQFCGALRNDGWRISVVWGPPVRVEERDSAAAAMRAIGVDVYDLGLVVAPTWRVWHRLVAIARKVRPTAVIGVMQRDRVVAMALSRRLGVPGIIAAQNQHMFSGSLPVSAAKRLLYRFGVSRWASLVVCASDPVRREILGFGVPEQRAVVVPNGIAVREPRPLSSEERRAARAELGAGPDDFLMLNVGRFDSQKGQDILVDAFATIAVAHPQTRLALIGGVSDGPARDRMVAFNADVRRRAEAAAVKDRIVFAGWRSDVGRLLGAADAYVHAARWEGFSFAVLEAFAASLPVVITDCSGYPEGFVDGRHGWVVPRGDAHALAMAMARVVALTPQARVTMGSAVRRLLEEHYDIRVIGARFAQLVARAMDQGR
jgi:glycosyltransferase involved in cell wall biosynthesis